MDITKDKIKEDLYNIMDVDETFFWSNNKRRMHGLPLVRQCGYQKRKINRKKQQFEIKKVGIFKYIEKCINEEMNKIIKNNFSSFANVRDFSLGDKNNFIV